MDSKGTVVFNETILPIVDIYLHAHCVMYRAYIPRKYHDTYMSGPVSVFGPDGKEIFTYPHPGFYVPQVSGDTWLELPTLDGPMGHPDPPTNITYTKRNPNTPNTP